MANAASNERENRYTERGSKTNARALQTRTGGVHTYGHLTLTNLRFRWLHEIHRDDVRTVTDEYHIIVPIEFTLTRALLTP